MFGKRLSKEDILKALKGLSDDEKAEIKSEIDDIYKAEDEREIDKVEEEKADTDEVADEKNEEVNEESEEIGKEVDELEDEVEKDEESKGVSKEETPEWAKAIIERLDVVAKAFAGDKEGVEKKAEEVYGLGNGVFGDEDKDEKSERMDGGKVKSILDKIKR